MPEPVVFIPGCGGDVAFWDEVRRAVDFPTLGIQRPVLTRPTLAAAVAQLDTEAPPRSIVVAHSMGAFHAEAFARVHPQRVAALLLVDPSLVSGGFRSSLPRPLAVGVDRAAAMLRLPEAARRMIGEWFAYREQANALVELRRSTEGPRCPTVVLTARPHPPARLRERLQALWGGPMEWREVARSGHLMARDRPDAIVEAVRELSRTGPAAPG